ncbi:hypothetical protein JCM6882_005093 [Rhodosporidiobolus microsporus]
MLGLTTSCGGPSQDEEAAPVPRKAAASVCARCKEPATIAVRVTAWCNDCFHRGFTSRFAKAMEPAKVVSNEGLDVFEGRKPERRRNDPAPAKGPGKLVIAFSGGASSRALLELVKTSYFSHLVSSSTTEASAVDETAVGSASTGAEDTLPEEDKKKKKASKKHGPPRPPAFSECEVVFVDESSVPGYGEDRTAEVRRIVEETAPFFRFTALKLEDVFSTTASPSSPLLRTSFASTSLPSISLSPAAPTPESATAKDRLLALLSPILLSPTSRASLQSSLLSTLLRSHAVHTSGAETLLLGTSATRISIVTLSGMAEGRSWSAGEEVAAHYVDRSAGADKPLLVVRPLALTLAKEVAYYSRTVGNGGLDSLVMRNASTSIGEPGAEKAPPVELKKKGIGALVEEFILSLEDDFPATVSTVVRTAHKLGLRSADAATRAFEGGADEDGAGCNCVVCGLPAQPDASAWRAAITISDLESAKQALAASGSVATLPTPTRLAAPAHPDPSAAAPARGKRLEPYQPSAAHLLPTSDSSPSAIASPSSAPATAPSPAASPDHNTAADNSSTTPLTLAPFLCYACLIILQEPTAASASLKASPYHPSIDLPPYVAAAVRVRVEREKRLAAAAASSSSQDGDAVNAARPGDGVLGTREVKGRDALRGEVAEFLLERENEGEE